MEKREFLKKVSAATLLTSLGITIDSCSPGSIPEPDPKPSGNDPVIIDITESPFTDLQNDQGWALDTSNKILLVNIGGNISALTSVCTHAGCSTDWVYSSSSEIFQCRCHNSEFDPEGAVVSGPANKPLSVFSVAQDGNILTITR